MNSIIINFFRLISISIYPTILLLFFLNVIRNKIFKSTIKENYKSILINTTIIFLIGLAVIFVFFSLEDTIYSYDYAGGWVRALELKRMFYESPSNILPHTYFTMNNTDYSYLPALFILPLLIFGSGSYLQYCISIFIAFIIPFFIYLQIIIFSFHKKATFLPIVFFVVFYPLYYIIFFGEIDSCGYLFILYLIYTLFIKDYKQLDFYDILFINLSSFLLLFLRRYYLYFVFCAYVIFLIKLLIVDICMNKNKFHKVLSKAFLTGIGALAIVIIFFSKYATNVLFNNFSEAYQMYNHSGKLQAFINYYSIPIILICVFGVIHLIRNRKYELLGFLTTSIILACILFWRIQSFEAHHYSLITIQVFILFIEGIYFIYHNNKEFLKIISLILIIQSANIFLDFIPFRTYFFTDLVKKPDIYEDKQSIQEFSNFLYGITKDEGMYVYFSTGDNSFSADIVMNSNLPNIYTRPKIYENVLDLRDGFPDLGNISYVVISNPTLYLNKDYQHNYDIISYAIENVSDISSLYELIYENEIKDLDIKVYKRIANFDDKTDDYFKQELNKFYIE